MTSYLDYTFFWGSQTPTGMAGISTNGPSSVPFACTPLFASQYFTFTWYQLGNGCPADYSWNPLSTCISTAGGYNTMTWGCTWTTSAFATSTINGGTTTAAPGQAATATANAVWITVTNTQQTTTTTTSTVAPGAKTVTVTSTQGVSKRDDYLADALFPARNYGVDVQKVVGSENATIEVLDPRAVCPANNINCGLNCCLSDQTCIAGGTSPCCNGWACVKYNPYEPFTGNIYWSWHGATTTSTSWVYRTTYTTVNAPGSTVTITPTSTTQFNLVQTQTVTSTITTSAPTVTSVNWIQGSTLSTAIVGNTGSGGISNTGNSPSSGSITSVSTSGAIVVTVPPSTFTSGGTPITFGGTTLTTGGTVFTFVLPQSSSSNTPVGNSTTTVPNNNLAIKVAAGVGTPLGICFIAFIIFLIFRCKNRKPKSPKPPPPNIIYGGDSEVMESHNANAGMGDASAYYTTANVASKPLQPATIVEHNPSIASPEAGYGGHGGGYGGMSPTSQHSQEMYAPTSRSSEIYTQPQPPRYASLPTYAGEQGEGQVGGYGGGHGNFVNEAETVSNRHELGLDERHQRM